MSYFTNIGTMKNYVVCTKVVSWQEVRRHYITFFLYFFAAVKGSANVGSTQVRSESAESVLVCNAHCAFVTHKTNPDAQLCMLWPK